MSSQSWFNTNYWSPNGIPAATDGAVINTKYVLMDGGVVVNSIVATAATLHGPGPLTVNHLTVSGQSFLWTRAISTTRFIPMETFAMS